MSHTSGAIVFFKASIFGVFQDAGEHQAVELTPHEEILGATAAFLHARGDRMVRWRSHTHRRHRQKSCPVLAANNLLTVFAIAGLLELTEKWQRVPAVTGEGTRAVYNMDALNARSYCKLAYDERI